MKKKHCGRIDVCNGLEGPGYVIGDVFVPRSEVYGQVSAVLRQALLALDPPLTALEFIWLQEELHPARLWHQFWLGDMVGLLEAQQESGPVPAPKRRRGGVSGARKREQVR